MRQKHYKILSVLVLLGIVVPTLLFPLHNVEAGPWDDIFKDAGGFLLNSVGCFGLGLLGGPVGVGLQVGINELSGAVGGPNACGGVGGAITATISKGAEKFLDIILNPLLELIVKIPAFLLSIAGRLLDLVLSAEFNSPFNITHNDFVIRGWTHVRDFANMFFILIMVVIAFATMFRQESYGIKRALPRLIITALVINFSRVITGVFLDAAQIFINFFLSALPQGQVGESLAASLNIGSILDMALSGEAGGEMAESVGYVIAFFILLFAAIAIGGFAILFIVRVVALWILIILSPLAFVAAILPATQQYFNMWWKNFITWTFWGVGATFFIWLAIWLGEFMRTSSFGGDISGAERLLVMFMRYFALLFFLVMGWNIALRSSGQAGTIVGGYANRFRRGTLQLAQRRVVTPVTRRAIREAEIRAGKPAAGWGARTAAQIAAGEGRVGRAISRVPVVGGMVKTGARQFIEPLYTYEEKVRGIVDQEIAGARKFSKDAQMSMARTTTDLPKRIAFQTALAEEGKLTKESGFGVDAKGERELLATMEAAERFGRSRPLMIARLEIAKQMKRFRKDDGTLHEAEFEKFIKGVRPAEGAKMSPEAIRDKEVTNAVQKTWAGEHYVRMAQEGTRDQIEALEQTLTVFGNKLGDIVRALTHPSINNERLARALERNLALLASYNIELPKKEGEEEKKTPPDEPPPVA